MGEANRTYVAIDLKSFYASVECVERGLNPLMTNLIVADASRTEKTICLAVSPSLKNYGIGGRARLFEVVQRVKEINAERRRKSPDGRLYGESSDDNYLRQHPESSVGYITAVPRMAHYIEYSTRIYQIYLKYIAPEDIHVYSIDEIFFDATEYLDVYHMTAHQLAMTMIRDVLRQTGITATAGIGTNLYLCKVAMDIVAKHIPADSDGVRIAELDEMEYRRRLWNHRPLTDFWRVGGGIAARLDAYGIHTMGQLARCSVENEELLYRLFGINAELLIDHAWGWEPCRISDVKAYRPKINSLSSGQVLQSAYTYDKAIIVAREMADAMALDLVSKRLVTDQLVLYVGYDRESLLPSNGVTDYQGAVVRDHYGRLTPKPVHATVRFDCPTSSSRIITDRVAELFEKAADRRLLVRRLNLTAGHVVSENEAVEQRKKQPVQLDLFTNHDDEKKKQEEEEARLAKERRMQEAAIKIKQKFGNNALLRGIDFAEGATARDRNRQIGGHKA